MLSRTPLSASSQQRSASHGLNSMPHILPTAIAANHASARLNHVRSASGPVATAKFEDTRSMTEIIPDFDVDLDELRPRKRVKIEEEKEIVASPQEIPQDAMHETMPGAALGLPRRATEVQRHVRRRDPEDPARKADGVTPPAMATKLPPPKNVADFSPWHGGHAEDAMNEQVVKNGYSEKGPSPNQNESVSARSMIWPALSNKSNVALHTLSVLFTQAMERRQALGRCTAPSTFKPPPRVTVTDTKREAWLRDLANTSIPLRRQSRTIPHGIRGKLLLEQCVAKSVPLTRAVWLAKCVGANELRAFRRKGVAGSVAAQGEAKWIRDWTLSVEQFLDETIRITGQQGWKGRLDYAIRLVGMLYSEDLIEREHFLDWIINGLNTTAIERAPFWLLLSKMCWRDICQYGRRGRSLAKALLKCRQTVVDSGHAAYDSLKAQICDQIQGMTTQAPLCLILPEIWDKSSSVLQELGPSGFDMIRQRTERLLRPNLNSVVSICDPVVQLYDMLDHIDLSVDIKQLCQDCVAITNITTLVESLLSWASTRYRLGAHRRTLVQRMIVELRGNGHDTDTALISSLAKNATPDMNRQDVYAIIAYLARNDSFSTGRLLKWLITSGALSQGADKLAAGYLLAMPNQGLAVHLHNTRTSLLSRLSGSELATMNEHTSALERAMDDLLSGTSDVSVSSLFAQYSSASIVEIADWLRMRLHSFKHATMTLHSFCIIRDAMEACHDIDGIVESLEIAMATDDFVVLASVAETINMHALELAIISKLAGLIDKLAGRYRLLRTQQPLEKVAINAVMSLVDGLDRQPLRKLLRSDLLLCERQNMSVVCSPASDNLISMHAGNIESDDEIEAVFASGNTMDEQLMHRLFIRIMHRAEKKPAPSPVCRWLAHLRSLDHTTFDSIVAAYTSNQLSGLTEGKLLAGIYAFLAADCYTIEKLTLQSHGEQAALAVLRLLRAPLDDQLTLGSSQRYHLEQQRQRFCDVHPGKVNELVLSAASMLASPGDDQWLCDTGVLLCNRQQPGKIPSKLCQRLLSDTDGIADLTPDKVIERATALNAQICAAWLRSCVDGSNETTAAVMQCIRSNSPVWPIMLQACQSTVVKSVYDWSLECLLKQTAEVVNAPSVFTLASYLLKDNSDAAFLGMIASQLKTVQKALGTDNPLDVTSSLELVRTLLRITILGDTQAESDASRQGRAYTVLALCSLLSTTAVAQDAGLSEHVADVANMYIDRLPTELISRLEKSARNAGLSKAAITTCFGRMSQPDTWLALASSPNAAVPRAMLKPGAGSSLNPSVQRPVPAPRPTLRGPANADVKYGPYNVRRWELLQDPTPVIGENDGSISLALFGARKV